MNRRHFLSSLAGLPVVRKLGNTAAVTSTDFKPRSRAEQIQGLQMLEKLYTVSMKSEYGLRQMTVEGDAEFCRTSVELWFKK